MTLLEYMASRLSKSNKEIKRAIERGACRVNGRVERVASRTITLNDRVEWHEVVIEKVVYDPARILFEDENLLAYNKPPGIACDEQGILHLLKAKAPLLLVHRLDKYTSGVLLLAKNKPAEKKMLEAFKQREVEKVYLALCDGNPKVKSGVIENYLGKIGGYQGQTLYGSVPPHLGKRAKTFWSVEKSYKNAALIRCYPETGRTHQIRVHMSEMGHPILGDDQYGKDFRCPLRPPRMMLHAYELRMGELKVRAPIPKDFQEVIHENFDY